MKPLNTTNEEGYDRELVTMSSKELANLTEKRHDNVKRLIEVLASQGVVTLPQIEEVTNDGPGPRTISVYRIGKRDSYIIVAQLSPEFTARLIDRWQVLEEVIARPNPMALLSDPAGLRMVLLQYTEKVLALEHEVSAQNTALSLQAPKAEALDLLATRADGSMCITNAAKYLQLPPGRLFSWLLEHKWIYRRAGGSGHVAYQQRIKTGCLEHKITMIERSNGSVKMVEQVLITAKGLAMLAIEQNSQFGLKVNA